MSNPCSVWRAPSTIGSRPCSLDPGLRPRVNFFPSRGPRNQRTPPSLDLGARWRCVLCHRVARSIVAFRSGTTFLTTNFFERVEAVDDAEIWARWRAALHKAGAFSTGKAEDAPADVGPDSDVSQPWSRTELAGQKGPLRSANVLMLRSQRVRTPVRRFKAQGVSAGWTATRSLTSSAPPTIEWWPRPTQPSSDTPAGCRVRGSISRTHLSQLRHQQSGASSGQRA